MLAAATTIRGAPIFRLVINPEARVSVEVTGRAPTVTCGERLPLAIEVINESLGTQTIRVRVLSPGARIVGQPLAPLSGAEREIREFDIQLDGEQPVDITLEFDAGPGTDDLGGRSQTHIYAACRAPET
jgi:hypothetical protein